MYWVLITSFCLACGLGLIIHFCNNRTFPKVLDDEGITTRSGKKYLWSNLVDWERHRLVLNSSFGPRITGNVTLIFTGGEVRIGSFPIANLNEVQAFLSRKFSQDVRPG
jgi:hypothetical protein